MANSFPLPGHSRKTALDLSNIQSADDSSHIDNSRYPLHAKFPSSPPLRPSRKNTVNLTEILPTQPQPVKTSSFSPSHSPPIRFRNSLQKPNPRPPPRPSRNNTPSLTDIFPTQAQLSQYRFPHSPGASRSRFVSDAAVGSLNVFQPSQQSKINTRSDDDAGPSLSATPSQSHKPHHEADPYQQCITLAMVLIGAKTTNKLISELKKDKAQYMADFLSKMISDEETFTRRDKKHSLHLLSKLAKSAEVFPQALELEGVQCNLSNFVVAGGYGFIYKGEYQQRPVCVKAVQIGLEGIDSKKIRAHASELTIWAHLYHPNVLPFLGIYPSKEEVPRICIVSPWMVNGDLLQYLKKVPSAPRKPLVRDIISGIQYLHDLDIIHADLKAKNVLISKTGKAMLADFGISRLSITQTTILTNVSTGTAYWMAPELHLDDEPRPTRETDIWAFACTCYEIITGTTPFSHYHNPALLIGAFMRGKNVPSKPIPGVGWDEDVWSMALRCWKRTPSSRPKAHELLDMINSFNFSDDRPSVSESQRKRNDINVDYNRISKILDEIRLTAVALKVDEELQNDELDVGTERLTWLRRGSKKAREIFQFPSRFLR